MKRVYNFSAGPSMLPEKVLRTAADEMLDYHGSGPTVPRSMTVLLRKRKAFSAR